MLEKRRLYSHDSGSYPLQNRCSLELLEMQFTPAEAVREAPRAPNACLLDSFSLLIEFRFLSFCYWALVFGSLWRSASLNSHSTKPGTRLRLSICLPATASPLLPANLTCKPNTRCHSIRSLSLPSTPSSVNIIERFLSRKV